MPVASDNYREYLSEQKPDHRQAQRVETIQYHAKILAGMILSEAPGGDDQQAALRYLRQAVMFACDAILMEGKV